MKTTTRMVTQLAQELKIVPEPINAFRFKMPNPYMKNVYIYVEYSDPSKEICAYDAWLHVLMGQKRYLLYSSVAKIKPDEDAVQVILNRLSDSESFAKKFVRYVKGISNL